MDNIAVVIIASLFTLINALLLLVLNQLWREIRTLREWKHSMANTMTAIEGRLREIERHLGIPPFGGRQLYPPTT